jgi:preprotein translocase SecE subunit
MKISSIIDYFSNVKLEFSKVAWLKPKELSQLLITVLTTTVLTACFFAVIDMISQTLIMRVIFM